MEPLLHFLQENVPWLIEHKYLFLFLGSLLEGLNTRVFGGFLASVGAVGLLPVFLVMTVGHTLNGYLWYTVGYFGGAKSLDRWGHKEKLSHDIIEKVSDYFNRYSGRTIMITKFTFSFQIATLILAGSVKHNLKEFSKYNFYGSLGWAAITILVGYVFGQSFQLFVSLLKNLTLFLVSIGSAIALVIVIKLLMKSAFIKALRLDARMRKWNTRFRSRFDTLMSDTTDNDADNENGNKK